MRRAAGALFLSLLLVEAARAGREPLRVFVDALELSTACPESPQFDPTVARRRQVILADSAFSEAGGPPRLLLNLFEDAPITVARDRVVTHRDGRRSWYGRVEGVAGGDAIFVVNSGMVTGNVRVGLRMFQVVPACEGIHEVREIDQSAFQDEAWPLHPEQRGEDVGIEPTQAASPDIGVMVAYTSAAAGAVADIQSRIQLGIDETNTEYANSGIAQRVYLAGTYQVDYAESGNSATDLSRLQAVADGYMDEVHTMRDMYGADIVSLWVNALDACGRGYLMTSVSSSFASNAFNVTKLSCATGYYSFGHEMGHNMGARHDWFVDSGTSPFEYAHGYAYPPGAWRTVMAYNDKCAASSVTCTRVPHFSNPDVTYSGAPTGIAQGNPEPADNAQTLDNTAGTVAAFRSPPGGCSYVLYATGASFGSAGGAGTFKVLCGTGCAWTATSNAAWITVTGGGSGAGWGVVSYSVSSSSELSPRTGTISAGGLTYTITQSAGGSCSYSIAPESQSFGAAGGAGSITVTATGGCGWTALSNAAWILITGGSSGTGSGTVSFAVSVNEAAAARSGTITAAGWTFTVMQDGTEGGVAPTINSYKSKKNKPGAAAKILGTGFDSDDTIKVVFGKKVAVVKSIVSGSSIKFTIPSSLKSGKKYQLYFEANGVRSNTVSGKLN